MYVENDIPKYLMYFNLDEYQESEFATIKKIIKHIANNRYYTIDMQIQFNNEIINYEAIRKEVKANNVMLIMGYINDELADDLEYEISTLLDCKSPIRHKSKNDFNTTGYTDEQLSQTYQDTINKSKEIQILNFDYDDNFKILVKEFIPYNLIYLRRENYLAFCNLMIMHVNNLDIFEMLQDFNACEALFKNFPYFIRYLQDLDIEAIVKYYDKDTFKILKNIRSFVRQSDDYNDNIRELFLYKFILQKFGISQFFFDPEEALNQIKEKINKLVENKNEMLIKAFDERVQLFHGNYKIISISDEETKINQAYKHISNNIKQHFEELKGLIRSFKIVDENFVQFNSKFNNQDLINKTLERLVKARIVKSYQEKYGLYKITLESTEHIPFLQGKWFEYYTANMCEEVLTNYQKQKYFVDYSVYQNIIVEINGIRRELDIIIYVNGKVFYIENKVESKNTFKTDIDKYISNTEKMNIEGGNYIVYLEGEERSCEGIKIYSFTNFLPKFKKEVLKIIEEDTKKHDALTKEKELKLQREKEMQKILDREIKALYLRHFVDYTKEEEVITKLNSRYDEEISKLMIPDSKDFFDDLQVEVKALNDKKVQAKFENFEKKYKEEYLEKIKARVNDDIYKRMYKDLQKLGYKDNFTLFYERLLCLNEQYDDFLKMGKRSIVNKAQILCGYGNRTSEYISILTTLITIINQVNKEQYLYYIIAYLKGLDKRYIRSLKATGALIDFMATFIKSRNIDAFDVKRTREQILAEKREKDFFVVLLCNFGKIHLKSFTYSGLENNYIQIFQHLIQCYNIEIFNEELKKDDIGKMLSNFNPLCKFFTEEQYIDVSSYLFLNYKVLQGTCILMKEVDSGKLICKLPRNDVILKLLKQLSESRIISSYKEVKKADACLAKFHSHNEYEWLVKYYWVGVYLRFIYEVKNPFINTMLKVKNKEVLLLMIKELNGKLLVCLGSYFTNFKIAVLRINVQELEQAILSIEERDFMYSILDIREVLDREIGGQNE